MYMDMYTNVVEAWPRKKIAGGKEVTNSLGCHSNVTRAVFCLIGMPLVRWSFDIPVNALVGMLRGQLWIFPCDFHQLYLKERTTWYASRQGCTLHLYRQHECFLRVEITNLTPSAFCLVSPKAVRVHCRVGEGYLIWGRCRFKELLN
jgi:hypothetical protein